MYDNVGGGVILGAATATVVLPATTGVTGVNFFAVMAVFAGIFIAYNVSIAALKRYLKNKYK